MITILIILTITLFAASILANRASRKRRAKKDQAERRQVIVDLLSLKRELIDPSQLVYIDRVITYAQNTTAYLDPEFPQRVSQALQNLKARQTHTQTPHPSPKPRRTPSQKSASQKSEGGNP